MGTVGLHEGDLVGLVEGGEDPVAVADEGEVVDPGQPVGPDLGGARRAVPPQRESDHGALVHVGGPDGAVVHLQAVGAEEAGRGQLGAARPERRVAAGGRYPPDDAPDGVGDVEPTGVQRQAVGQAVARQRGDPLGGAAGGEPPDAGEVVGAGGVQEVQRAVRVPDQAGDQREAEGRCVHAAVGRCGQGRQHPDGSALGDPGDLASGGEGQVDAAVRVQGDVLRHPAGARVEVLGDTSVRERCRGGRRRAGPADREGGHRDGGDQDVPCELH